MSTVEVCFKHHFSDLQKTKSETILLKIIQCHKLGNYYCECFGISFRTENYLVGNIQASLQTSDI